MKRFFAVIGSTICVMALIAGVLAGCSSNASNLTDSQQANRAYMSQVNEIMSELDENLDSFVDAVSDGDVVAMRTQADTAYKTLDKLEALEAPEGFEDIQKDYVDGTKKLREALDGYITLYAEAGSGSLDQATYASRIASIQSLYDEGVSTLEKADAAAAEKE